MLDLKAKLASAGLVSSADIARVEQEKIRSPRRPRRQGNGAPPPRDTGGLPVDALRGRPKAEIYEAVRRWVDQVRLDPARGVPSDDAATFHFPQATGRVGRLVLEPEVRTQLEDGTAGVVSYMSNHGLAHAVVPAAGARALAELNPLWLRVLSGDPQAGQIEPREV
jgi:hypothetical protein